MMKVLRSPITTVVLFAVAAILLFGGSIGAVQAAPNIQSRDYRAEVELTDIETALLENGTIVEGDDELLTKLLADAGDDELKIGKEYNNYELAVRNVGTIDQYVRVTVNKFWEDANGKAVDLDPDLIKLNFVEGDGWTIDEDASTEERTVLYYADTVAPGEDTKPFTDKLTIDGSVLTQATKLADGTNEFDYNGVTFRIKATVDAVQTHNGEAAMTSAWGRTNKG